MTSGRITSGPRLVFGMPAYRRPDALARTLESLLGQTRGDLAIVITDDAPSPEVRAIVDTYVRLDARVTYEANPQRLGMVGNWRLAFARARALHPGADLFAWVSDHDVWHPRWFEVLAAALDAQPGAVMAYPHALRMHRFERRRVDAHCDTTAAADRRARLWAVMNDLTAGNAIYGLFRTAALERAGVFRPVLLPDRQVLAHLALLGSFVQVPETLWYREASVTFSYRRQRETFFAGRTPLHAWLPGDLQHAALMWWDFAVRGAGGPDVGRAEGATHAAALLWYALTRDRARWRAVLGRTGSRQSSPGASAAPKARRLAARTHS